MSLQTTRYRVKITFVEPILGSTSMDKDVWETFVQSKQLEVAKKHGVEVTAGMLVEELEAVQNLDEKGRTGFMKKDGNPVLMNYVITGFFKAACQALRRAGLGKSNKLSAFKKTIDQNVFIRPRFVELHLPSGGEIGTLSRPLRAQTAQGERVALASSDTAPAGTWIEFEVHVLGDAVSRELLVEWFDYGQFSGLGQWRSGGYGTFEYTLISLD